MIELSRVPLGFHNPNHTAALLCAVLPLCWGWRRHTWIGHVLAGVLFAMVLLTQSRTGLLVAGLETVAWWWISRRGAARSASAPYRRWGLWIMALVSAGVALWWMGPRLVLDDSILNRPKIWLAGLQLFAANPNGVGLGNSGTIASAFLLDGIPEIRTMVNAHITLLAELGWIVGWAWFAFIGLALCGVRDGPRVGIAFAGLALSGCSSTVFDWPVLFDFTEQGGLGMANWILSWMMFVGFVGFGVWLVVRRARRARPTVAMFALVGVVVMGLRTVPTGDAPEVRGGYVVCGEAPRTLVLYDASWKLKTVVGRVKDSVILPVRGVSRFPRDLDMSGVGGVILFGGCREWAYLVKGVQVECASD